MGKKNQPKSKSSENKMQHVPLQLTCDVISSFWGGWKHQRQAAQTSLIFYDTLQRILSWGGLGVGRLEWQVRSVSFKCQPRELRKCIKALSSESTKKKKEKKKKRICRTWEMSPKQTSWPAHSEMHFLEHQFWKGRGSRDKQRVINSVGFEGTS